MWISGFAEVRISGKPTFRTSGIPNVRNHESSSHPATVFPGCFYAVQCTASYRIPCGLIGCGVRTILLIGYRLGMDLLANITNINDCQAYIFRIHKNTWGTCLIICWGEILEIDSKLLTLTDLKVVKVAKHIQTCKQAFGDPSRSLCILHITPCAFSTSTMFWHL